MKRDGILEIDAHRWRRDRAVQTSSLAARGLWLEMKMIMAEAETPGTLVDRGHQFNAETLAGFLRMDQELVRRALDELERNGVFAKLTDGTLYDRDMYEADAKRRYLHKVRGRAGKTGAKARWQGKHNGGKMTISQEEIFTAWNAEKIIVHRTLDDKTKRTINGALRNNTAFEIITAIKNYAKILNNPQFFWTYKWTLKDFIARGLEKFRDWEIARANYYRQGFAEPGTAEEVEELMPDSE